MGRIWDAPHAPFSNRSSPLLTAAGRKACGVRGSVKISYDEKSAAEMLSISQRHMADLRRAGKFLAVREGRGWKYRHADLEMYADGLVKSAEWPASP